MAPTRVTFHNVLVLCAVHLCIDLSAGQTDAPTVAPTIPADCFGCLLGSSGKCINSGSFCTDRVLIDDVLQCAPGFSLCHSSPTTSPTSPQPTMAPTASPTKTPTDAPSASPTVTAPLDCTDCVSGTGPCINGAGFCFALTDLEGTIGCPPGFWACEDTTAPTSAPTVSTNSPTSLPSSAPSNAPSNAPTPPTHAPTASPTHEDCATCTGGSGPCINPSGFCFQLIDVGGGELSCPPPDFVLCDSTEEPTATPTSMPTNAPTTPPTTAAPTDMPTDMPTNTPTTPPTIAALADMPTNTPTTPPTTATPTDMPTSTPMTPPTSAAPTDIPTSTPTDAPSYAPTDSPSTPNTEVAHDDTAAIQQSKDDNSRIGMMSTTAFVCTVVSTLVAIFMLLFVLWKSQKGKKFKAEIMRLLRTLFPQTEAPGIHGVLCVDNPFAELPEAPSQDSPRQLEMTHDITSM